MNITDLFPSPEALKHLCEEEDIAYLGLFGSYARGEARPDSDVDILYEFDHDSTKSLFDVVHVKQKLEDMLGKKVDVASRHHLKPLLKPYILPDVVTLYEKE